MSNYAYVRVSCDTQDVNNQKFGILQYCNAHNIHNVEFVEDEMSGQVHWNKRGIGHILAKVQKGDHVITSEISRLSRVPLHIYEIMECAAAKEIKIHAIKENITMDSTNSMTTHILVSTFGLAAYIERALKSGRTKESLARLKQQGIRLGRPPGKATSMILDKQEEQIDEYLKMGLNKTAISKLLECCYGTLYNWLKRKNKGNIKRRKKC